VHNDKIGKLVGLVFYIGLFIGSQIGMCLVPQGPTLARIALLITYISSSTLYFAHVYWVHTVIVIKLKSIVGDRDSAISTQRATDATLHKLINDTEETKKVMIVLFVINIVFSVCPPLYPFYYVIPGLLMGASGGKGNPMRYLSKGKRKSSGAGNPETAPTAQRSSKKLFSPLYWSRPPRPPGIEFKSPPVWRIRVQIYPPFNFSIL
jgi:hypothetical protein